MEYFTEYKSSVAANMILVSSEEDPSNGRWGGDKAYNKSCSKIEKWGTKLCSMKTWVFTAKLNNHNVFSVVWFGYISSLVKQPFWSSWSGV